MPSADERETTIHLTGRPPISIKTSEWPVIARYTWPESDPEKSTERAYVRVRRHADGRTIVYGLRARGAQEQMVGFLVRDYAVADAIRNACAQVGLEPQGVFDDMPPEAL